MPRRINQVKYMILSLVGVPHSDWLHLDSNTPLTFEVHRVQNLLLHFSRLHGLSNLQHAIGQS